MEDDDTFQGDYPDCDLGLYFSQSQLNDMSMFDKMIAYNKMKNYFICHSLDLYCEMPKFMKKAGDIKQESPRRKLKLSEDVKKTLQFSEIPLSYVVGSEQEKVESGQCSELPLCKNEKYLKQIFSNIVTIAPTAIEELEDNYNIKKEALEKFKKHEIGISELQLFFTNNINQLDAAIENLSLQEKDVSKGRYAFRKLARKDYSKFESYGSDEETSESGKSVTRVDWYLPKSFAAKTLPDGLTLKPSELSSASVFTTQQVKKGTIFGPYVGVRMYDDDVAKVSGRVWEIFVGGQLHHYVDGDDPEQSNWMRYINHATSPQLQNLESFQFHYKVYYKTTTDIPSDTELLVWYSENYNQDDFSDRKSTANTEPIKPKSEIIESNVRHGHDKCSKDNTNLDDIFGTSDLIKADISLLTDLFAEYRSTSVRESSSSDYNNQSHGITHECDVCFTSFTDETKFKDHLKIHMNAGPYKCDVCSVSFKRLDRLEDHARIHAVEKPHKCHACGDSFKLLACLVEHSRCHKVEGDHLCHLCGASFTHASTLENHFMTHEVEKHHKSNACETSAGLSMTVQAHKKSFKLEKPYKCSFCGISFECPGQLKHHMRIHTGERPHKCHTCKGSFRSNYYLNRHIKTVHTLERPYKCDVCGGLYKSKCYLKFHMQSHASERHYKCHVCNKASFKCKYNLIRHMKIHASSRPFQCETCGVSFENSDDCISHRRMHFIREPCKQSSNIPTLGEGKVVASKSFNSHGNLFEESNQFKEQMAADKEIKSHECEASKASFKKHDLSKCRTVVRPTERLFMCGVCSSSFKHEHDLKAHLELHASDRFFKCDTCNASFSCSLYLDIHKRVHTAKRPYKCEECRASFERKDHLEGHIKIHKTSKSYKCGYCDNSFSLNDLKVHRKVHEESLG